MCDSVDKSQTHAKSAQKLQKLPQKAVKKWLILNSQSSENWFQDKNDALNAPTRTEIDLMHCHKELSSRHQSIHPKHKERKYSNDLLAIINDNKLLYEN